MNSNLSVIGTLGQLNSSESEISFSKFVTFLNPSNTYALYVFTRNAVRFCKLSLEKISLSETDVQSQVTCGKPTFVSLWRTLMLPFDILDIHCTNDGILAVGENDYAELNPNFRSSNDSLQAKHDDLMDIDDESGFPCEQFKTYIKTTSVHKHIPFKEVFCIQSELLFNSVCVCYKNLESQTWCLRTILTRRNLISRILLIFPISFKQGLCAPDKGDEKDFLKPQLVLFSVNTSVNLQQEANPNILQKLCSSSSDSSNAVCIIGHPEGRVLFSVCKCTERDFRAATSPETLFDLKQSVVGIHYQEEVRSTKGGFLLVIGSFGKLVLLSAKQVYSNSTLVETGKDVFWALTLHLSYHVQSHVVLGGCVVHSSNAGKLWITKFTESDDATGKGKKELKIDCDLLEMKGVRKITLMDELQGFLLLTTESGSLYVCQLIEKNIVTHCHHSLPELMNENMHQSCILERLSTVRRLQSKIFAAVSTFATLKFNGPNMKLNCSIKEMDLPPKRIFLCINLQGLEVLNLDCDLWLVSASVYSYFQTNTKIISKTGPFIQGQDFLMEMQESILSPSHVSLFPLYLEVGLVLSFPRQYESIDCLKPISEKLPLYIGMQTFILNELYLLKSLEHKMFQSVPPCSTKSILSQIYELSAKKPISRLIQMDCNAGFMAFQNIKKYTFSLLASSFSDILKNSISDSDTATKFLQFLGEKFNLPNFSEDNTLMCRNQDVHIVVHCNQGVIYVKIKSKSTDILYGLRMAMAALLLNNQSNLGTSKYVTIPASLNRKCEELSQSLLGMYGQDVMSPQFSNQVMDAYNTLRKEISETLPY